MYIEYNLLELGLLPLNWEEDIRRTAKAHSIHAMLGGASITSRESQDFKSVSTYVVTGDFIQKELAWLHQLYNNELLNFSSELPKKKLVVSDHILSGININILRGVGARYELHVDSNPVTGLLFVTTHNNGDGGELVFKMPNEDIIIYPKSGTYIVFDAREIPHAVLPLLASNERISVPMNFYLAGRPQERPADLDGYLYTHS